MAIVEEKCPDCGERKVVKHGKNKRGEQRYYCQNEKYQTKTFMLEYKY